MCGTILRVLGLCRNKLFHFITYIHSFIQSHSYIPFIPLYLLRSLSISSPLVCSVGKHLPVVPSRALNSGLPYSKLTRYQLCHAAPKLQIVRYMAHKLINNGGYQAQPKYFKSPTMTGLDCVKKLRDKHFVLGPI